MNKCFGIGILLVALFFGTCFTPGGSGGVQADTTEILYPYGAAQPSDPELKNLEWNRYTTQNFTVLSIDDGQGKWLKNNLEQIRKWTMTRWGFPDTNFSKECRVFCVPNKALLKKLFNLDQSKVEIRKKDGKFEMTAMWLVLDDTPARTIPVQLTLVCLAEFEARHGVTMGWWFKRGAGELNGTIPDIRTHVANLSDMLKKDQPLYVSEKMFTMTEEDYFKESVENRKVFDRQAVALCILLRKEFGEAKLQGFLRIASKNNAQDVLRVVYGFDNYAHFDKSYIRFMQDLTRDVLANKTPDSYLEIRPVR